MPKFYRADQPAQGEPVRRDTWAAGDVVYMRAAFTVAMQRELARSTPLPAGMTKAQFVALPEDERRQIVEAQTDDIGMGITLVRMMVTGWTFRYPPTDEQTATGQLGDLVPVTDETIGELDDDDFQFLTDEVQKRMKSVTSPTDVAAEVPLAPETFPPAPAPDDQGQVPA